VGLDQNKRVFECMTIGHCQAGSRTLQALAEATRTMNAVKRMDNPGVALPTIEGLVAILQRREQAEYDDEISRWKALMDEFDRFHERESVG
jgi:hypothetical protein